MTNDYAFIAGEIAGLVPKARMAGVLRSAGLRVYVGPNSIRVEDCSHFVFQEYDEHDEPRIDADADSSDEMLREGKLVSDALSRAGIKHRFEIYSHGRDDMVGYLHYDWPPRQEGE